MKKRSRMIATDCKKYLWQFHINPIKIVYPLFSCKNTWNTSKILKSFKVYVYRFGNCHWINVLGAWYLTKFLRVIHAQMFLLLLWRKTCLKSYLFLWVSTSRMMMIIMQLCIVTALHSTTVFAAKNISWIQLTTNQSTFSTILSTCKLWLFFGRERKFPIVMNQITT